MICWEFLWRFTCCECFLTPRTFSHVRLHIFPVFLWRSFPLGGDFWEELVRPGPLLHKTSNIQQQCGPPCLNCDFVWFEDIFNTRREKGVIMLFTRLSVFCHTVILHLSKSFQGLCRIYRQQPWCGNLGSQFQVNLTQVVLVIEMFLISFVYM